MGDISAEPSMEDILSSIKRIIAEEGDAVPIRQRRAPRVVAPSIDEDDDESDLDQVLELNDPMPSLDVSPSLSPAASVAQTEEELPRSASSDAAPARAARSQPAAATVAPMLSQPAEPAPAPEADGAPILSHGAANATRGSLEALSRMMVKPDTGSDGTLEGMVREMLRPMLREWLDAKLPPMVEAMVAAEIARITGQGR